MSEDDRRALIEAAVPAGAGAWVELGSGRGVLTSTLAGRLGEGARILSIDRDRAALAEQRRVLEARHPGVRLELRAADLAGALDLGHPDGVLAANALHYVPPAPRGVLLTRLREALAPRGGRLVVIEYDTRRANPWVPYPLPLARLRREAADAGFGSLRGLARVAGNFGSGVYAALCLP